MIKMGMMIGDRYEILEPIGTGGMSDVYKAKCHKLNRFVAVKVLKQEFSESAEFVSKFRTEAQAAAGLMHPNIVNVYDVGEESGINYIVMELVEGITLKRYIEKKARLSVKEAVSIAIQISMGIEAAHNNNIIHRDIKPQNIIISKEGKVKVTDFGIAKAATSNTITSNVMGSVHYTSPEQARGGFSDEKSDIYSLGITMFEMLTGRVPFNGDTTVAIAIKHIQEEMPSPRNYVPEIPISVEQIVLKCTQKSPDRRYQKMPELVEDLKKSLISPNEDFVKLATVEKSAVTKAMSDKEREQIKRSSAVKKDAVVTAAAAGGITLQNTEKQADKKTAAAAGGSQVSQTPKKPMITGERPKRVRQEEELAARKKTTAPVRKTPPKAYEEDEEDSPLAKLKTILIILVAVVVGCVVLYFAGMAMGLFGERPPVEQNEDSSSVTSETDDKSEETVNGVAVPGVINKSEAEATAILEKEGFVVEKIEEYNDQIVKGNIISQTPSGGSLLERGGTVSIVISNGKLKTDVSMPNLINMSEEQAKQALSDMGLKCGSVTEEYSDTVESGKVCYQSYTEGASVDEGTEINIKLSLGPEPRYYDCNITVAAPPRFTSGTATVVLRAPDGSELWNTTVSSFPVQINLSNIYAVPKGTLTITYTVYVQEEVYDAAGNMTIQNVPAQDTYTQEVTFE